MGNPTDQQRLEQIEQMAALEGRLSKKQEASNRFFSQLLEGQMRLLKKEQDHMAMADLKKQKGTDRIFAQLLEVQMRLLEKEGSTSYGHGGHQEFSRDQREPKDRGEEDEPFNHCYLV
jgi:hypothetical protein